jgi:hypothetical protein
MKYYSLKNQAYTVLDKSDRQSEDFAGLAKRDPWRNGIVDILRTVLPHTQ